MKKILGSIILLISFLYGYEIEVFKTNPFLKEPVLLKLKYFDKDYKEITWVKFEPKDSSSYEKVFLKKKIKDGEYIFEYLLFPIRSGKVKIDYVLKIKKAPVEEIRKDILGTGYEQTNPIEGKIYSFEVTPTILDVKDVKSVDLYGDFSLKEDVDKKEANSYEPIYFTLTLEGCGYAPKIDDIFKEIKGVKILKDKPIKNISYSKNGACIKYIYNYALISKSSFKIPSIKLKEFDYKDYKTLSTKSYDIKIIPPKNLVDKIDEPRKIVPVFDRFKSLLVYLFIFISGILTGVILYLLYRKKRVEEIILAKDEKELLSILAIKYPDSLENLKKELDEAISQKRKINLAKIKAKIIKEIKKEKR
ncbi:hypothetical protein [Nitrosophilus kaiyonis]|uniref:hypothetical protein n=1 Tax=Nitrosophilus kaiyonis TaxID=2930200 RepID=UPI002492F81D|nr:hypothetical protein [Nitrosophilus kaiyonis]